LAPATAQCDNLGQHKAASGILKGGSAMSESAGKEKQKFGDAFPEWRTEMNPGAAGPHHVLTGAGGYLGR